MREASPKAPTCEAQSCPACICQAKFEITIEIYVFLSVGVSLAFVIGVLVGRGCGAKNVARVKRARDDRVQFNAAEIR